MSSTLRFLAACATPILLAWAITSAIDAAENHKEKQRFSVQTKSSHFSLY